MEESKKKTFTGFIKSNPFNAVLISFFLLLGYGIKLFNVTISHDTEAILSTPNDLYNSWYGMGRYGEMIIKKLLGTYWFNPYIAEFMMLVCLLVGSLLWGYLFYKAGMKCEKFVWVFGAVWASSIITAEQTAFLLQSYEVVLSILLIAVSLLAFYKWHESKKWYYLVLSVAVLWFCFSIYQSNVAVYISGAVMLFIAFYDAAEDKTFKDHLFFILELIGIMAAALVLYYIGKAVVARLGYPTNNYVDDQMLWGNASIKECIIAILKHIKDILTGKGIFYNLLLPAVMLLSFVCLIFNRKKKAYFVYVIALLTLFACPFLMTFVLGQSPSARAEMSVPFVTAFLCLYVVSKMPPINAKFYKTALIAVFIACMVQAQATSRLYYTEYVKGREEEALALKITDRIEKLETDLTKTPVVFIGATELKRNDSCYDKSQLELTGYSFFEVSFSAQHGTVVMNRYLRTLGAYYAMPTTVEQLERAEQLSVNMPSWPANGSVALKEGIIIVKF